VQVDDVTTELRRVIRRWQQLPAGRAHENASLVRELAQDLADRTRARQGLAALAIPDVGDGALADQLAVMVYDACRAGLDDEALRGLTRVRRSLP